jgi:mono/diheme cytochrome c family protein
MRGSPRPFAGEYFMNILPKTPRALAVLLSSLTAAGVVVSAALTAPMRPVAADAAKPDQTQVKALYAEKCSACHNLPSPEEKGYTRAEWQRTVNTMLTKYHASDEIAPNEAAQIVDYLATFAPKAQAGGRGRQNSDPWATDGLDVWTDAPSASRVFNFEAGGLAGLAPLGSGTSGPAPMCTVRPDKPGADGLVAHVSGPNFRPDHFAVLLDRTDAGRNLDIHVRFRIDAGKVSPAVGIVFGYTGPNQYTVLRCNQALGDLALIQIAGPTHTTLQQTSIVLPAPSAAPASAPLPAVPPSTPLAGGWHTLRLLVRDGQARGWIDMEKRISVSLPSVTPGKVGLWTQGNTSASFDDWTIDCYDAPSSAPAPLS